MALVTWSGCAEELGADDKRAETDTALPLEAETPSRAQRFACEDLLRGEGLTQSGQTVRYDIDRARQTYTLTLLSEAGDVLAKGTSAQWNDSEDVAAAMITLEDASGATQYAATAHTSFVPGYGL